MKMTGLINILKLAYFSKILDIQSFCWQICNQSFRVYNGHRLSFTKQNTS
jgi:hypothetical protein